MSRLDPRAVDTSDYETPGPASPELARACKAAGLYAIQLAEPDQRPLIVHFDGQRRTAEALGRRLVLAMREAVREPDGHEDPSGAVVAAACSFVELCGGGQRCTPAEYRAAIAALADAAAPYLRGDTGWDAEERRELLTNGQRAYIRAYASRWGLQ